MPQQREPSGFAHPLSAAAPPLELGALARSKLFLPPDLVAVQGGWLKFVGFVQRERKARSDSLALRILRHAAVKRPTRAPRALRTLEVPDETGLACWSLRRPCPAFASTPSKHPPLILGNPYTRIGGLAGNSGKEIALAQIAVACNR